MHSHTLLADNHPSIYKNTPLWGVFSLPLYFLWYDDCMERQDSGGIQKRPELDRTQPSQLFEYARLREAWILDRISTHQHADAVDHLVDELTGYVAETYEQLPEVRVRAVDVMHTSHFSEPQPGHYQFTLQQLPFDADAKILGEHTIDGVLYGFHRGEENELRMYVARGELSKNLQGGIYTPLLSIGMKETTVQLRADERAQLLAESGSYISELADEQHPELKYLTEQIGELLDAKGSSIARKLHQCSPLLAEIARHPEVPEKIVDALLDYIRTALDLNSPQDIQTSKHRVHITEQPVRAYQPAGEALFQGVTPQLGLMGESASRSLGLFISNEEKFISIPVEFVTVIEKAHIARSP